MNRGNAERFNDPHPLSHWMVLSLSASEYPADQCQSSGGYKDSGLWPFQKAVSEPGAQGDHGHTRVCRWVITPFDCIFIELTLTQKQLGWSRLTLAKIFTVSLVCSPRDSKLWTNQHCNWHVVRWVKSQPICLWLSDDRGSISFNGNR